MGANKSIARAGLTWIELAVIIVIIAVLAVFAVPRFRASAEKSKAIDAFYYLASIQVAQERCHAKQGSYASDLAVLDIQITAPNYFTVGSIVAGITGNLEDSWSLTLTRNGSSGGYGEYTITYTERGFDTKDSTIVNYSDIIPIRMNVI